MEEVCGGGGGGKRRRSGVDEKRWLGVTSGGNILKFPILVTSGGNIMNQLVYMSRWNELRSSSTAPFFGRSAGWTGGEAFGRCKEQYSMVRECCSTCLSNYGSRMCRRYIMVPLP